MVLLHLQFSPILFVISKWVSREMTECFAHDDLLLRLVTSSNDRTHGAHVAPDTGMLNSILRN